MIHNGETTPPIFIDYTSQPHALLAVTEIPRLPSIEVAKSVAVPTGALTMPSASQEIQDHYFNGRSPVADGGQTQEALNSLDNNERVEQVKSGSKFQLLPRLGGLAITPRMAW